MAGQGLRPAGKPYARYVPSGDGGFDVEAGFPVGKVLTPSGRAVPSQLEAGHVACTVHRGAYNEVRLAYEALEKWVIENGHRATAAPWESYLDDPEAAEPRTEADHLGPRDRPWCRSGRSLPQAATAAPPPWLPGRRPGRA